MSIEDDITDDMVAKMAARLGLGSSPAQKARGGIQYEAIRGHAEWHVMRICAGRRERVGVVPTQEDANAMIRTLQKADAGDRS